ncbi:GNAT family N-acetyltransferase [Phenylobacterium sp.]|uniref:GNAT family N-acetyltransferase n=1 Tax=Phenylobacterium sp. TaxID=1871053 RepID=UPI0030F3D8D6
MRAHPNFPAAFLAAEHTAQPALTLGPLRTLFKDRGSQTIGTLALCLHDTEEGLTAGRLTRMCVESGICSAGRVESYLALMRQRGALIPLARSSGLSIRYGFSEDYLSWFRDYLRHGLQALALVDPPSAAVMPLMDGADFFHFSRRILASASVNPPLTYPGLGPELLLFAQRDAGLAILSDLVAGQLASGRGAAPVSVADLARRHGVSRAHVLKLLRDADEAGAFAWKPDKRTVTLPAWLLDRLEHGVAVALLNRRYAAHAVLAAPRGMLTVRPAVPADIETLRALMEQAIRIHLAAYLPPEGVAASFEIMGLDTQLIEDGTYFVVEAGGRIAGCGGWSRRATLFGGDHSAGRDSGLVDPATEPARIRAMYTHPDFARRGVGKLILDTCEAAAAAEGFGRCEMAATLSGEPLYRATGYRTLEHFEAETSTGFKVPLIRMGKTLV